MNSVSFSAPQRALPRFGGDNRREPRPYHSFNVSDTGTNPYASHSDRYQQSDEAQHNRDNAQENALSRAAKKTGKVLGVAGIIAAVTSPLWAPITGVGVACNANGPEGAIAKIKPVAGAGPAVADALCPSVFVMPDGDLISNDPPSWTSFTNKVGHVYGNGLVTSRDKVEGAYKDGSYYDGGLIKGLQAAQIASSDPENFEITVTKGAAPSKKVDDDGTVTNALKHNGFHQKEGSVKLMGPYEGKSLADVPKAERELIKAAAAAHSYTWAG